MHKAFIFVLSLLILSGCTVINGTYAYVSNQNLYETFPLKLNDVSKLAPDDQIFVHFSDQPVLQTYFIGIDTLDSETYRTMYQQFVRTHSETHLPFIGDTILVYQKNPLKKVNYIYEGLGAKGLLLKTYSGSEQELGYRQFHYFTDRNKNKITPDHIQQLFIETKLPVKFNMVLQGMNQEYRLNRADVISFKRHPLEKPVLTYMLIGAGADVLMFMIILNAIDISGSGRLVPFGGG